VDVGTLHTGALGLTQGVSHVTIVGVIFVKVWELPLGLTILVPEAPRLVLVCTAAREDVYVTGSHGVFARIEGFQRRISCYQMLVEMSRKLPAHIISNLRVRIHGDDHRHPDTLKKLPNHLRMAGAHKY